jgi:diguanylate cyclase (GGDEF)-like protein
LTAEGEREGERDRLLAQVLVEFARNLGSDFSIQKILDHLVLSIVEILPVTGAGVMLMGADDQLHFLAASNEKVMAIETLQNELREGPCLEAYLYGLPVAISDLRVDTRFSRFSPRACADGLAAVFTFPLTLDDTRLGALDLYRDTPGELSEQDVKAAQVLADVASAYLFNAQARIDSSATVARLHHRSLHDPLTGLPNRALLEQRLEQAVARARRSHKLAAVLFIDLDGFKPINDRYGHHVGDLLLFALAERLSRVLRPGDTLARLGGDEFVVLCEDLDDSSGAETVARRINAAMSGPFHLGGHDIDLTASVGISLSGRGEDRPDVLLRNADFAMYQAKQSGGGCIRLSDPVARRAADLRRDLEDDLRTASERDELALLYQPIVDVRSGDLMAVEALLRWTHPTRGLVMPEVIIPSAERTGAILELGEWVLRQACQDLERWRRQGTAVPSVTVNVSAQQVMGPAFANTVKGVLRETHTDPGSICLEITETVFLADSPRALAVLKELKGLGVRLWLDDFGTGYSSLNYLRQFPFDSVKMDRSFTSGLATDEVTRSIVSAVVDLSHVMDLTITAEGVETPREVSEITELGVDYAQGFHFSPPLTRDELTRHAGTVTAASGSVSMLPAPRPHP